MKLVLAHLLTKLSWSQRKLWLRILSQRIKVRFMVRLSRSRGKIKSLQLFDLHITFFFTSIRSDPGPLVIRVSFSSQWEGYLIFFFHVPDLNLITISFEVFLCRHVVILFEGKIIRFYTNQPTIINIKKNILTVGVISLGLERAKIILIWRT